MTFEFGDLVAVAFPFTEQSASKRRPAVVISGKAYNEAKSDIILAAITSRIAHADEPGDFALADWEAAGLLKPSAVKLVVGTFDKQLFRNRFGHLSVADQAVLRQAIRSMFYDDEPSDA